jgi:hypothetical protein
MDNAQHNTSKMSRSLLQTSGNQNIHEILSDAITFTNNTSLSLLANP